MRGSVQCYFILSQLARFCKKNLRKFADDGGVDCDARRRPSRRKIALPRARSISRSIGAAPQPHRSPPQELCKFRRFPLARSGILELHCLPHVRRGFEYVRHAAEFMKFRCPAYARRRIYSARGAYRAGRGCFRNLQIEFRCFNNVNQNRNEKTHTFGALLPCTVCSRVK